MLAAPIFVSLLTFAAGVSASTKSEALWRPAGPTRNDISCTNGQDCWLAAAMGSIVKMSESWIQKNNFAGQYENISVSVIDAVTFSNETNVPTVVTVVNDPSVSTFPTALSDTSYWWPSAIGGAVIAGDISGNPALVASTSEVGLSLLTGFNATLESGSAVATVELVAAILAACNSSPIVLGSKYASSTLAQAQCYTVMDVGTGTVDLWDPLSKKDVSYNLTDIIGDIQEIGHLNGYVAWNGVPQWMIIDSV